MIAFMQIKKFFSLMSIFKLFSLSLICIVTILISCVSVSAKIITKNVDYKEGEIALRGFMAYDDSLIEPRPGVLIVHEWNGLGTYVKIRAKQIAELGYIAFCADMYGKNAMPRNREESSKQASIYRNDRILMRNRVITGLEEFKKQNMVDKSKIAAIGYCFGGGTVLELARSGADVSGVVSFHGNLDTPNLNDAKNIKTRILVLHGADDPNVSSEQIRIFQKEMRDSKVDWQMIFYGNAVHSFTNPDSGNNPEKGAAYNEKADKRSWDAMRVFFNEIFLKN